ncbi:MAG: hypothetical protein AAF658_19495, partial [Myxococcota bacterium]
MCENIALLTQFNVSTRARDNPICDRWGMNTMRWNGCWAAGLMALAGALSACETPFLQSVDGIDAANDGGRSCAPAPAQDLAVTPENDHLALSWTLNALDQSGVILERRNPGETWAELVQLGPTSDTFDDFSVTLDTNYEYRVIPFRLLTNEICPAVASEPVLVTTRPNPMSDFQLDFVNGDINISWTDPNA